MFVSWKHLQIAIVAASFFGLSAPALGQFDSGSDGSDGALNCATLAGDPLFDCAALCTVASPCEFEIDLTQALDGQWDMSIPPASEGRGVYDPDVWAVVFKYTTIDIPANVTVTFINHEKGAPVVWLAQWDVNVNGTIDVNGGGGKPAFPPSRFSIAGPGGFEGGQAGISAHAPSGGFGPGGAGSPASFGSGGGYATDGQGPEPGKAYGNEWAVPLIGGSGGGPDVGSGGGGGGGGGVLIASTTQINLPTIGSITANGGRGRDGPFAADGGGGSGGTVRLIANILEIDGTITATGGQGPGTSGPNDGSDGRVRLETNTKRFSTISNPAWVESAPGEVFPSNAPTLTVVQIDGQTVPTDPLAGILTTDLTIDNEGTVNVLIEATGLPVNTTTCIEVRLVPSRGTALAEFSNGLQAAGVPPCGAKPCVVIPVTGVPRGRVEIQARAVWPQANWPDHYCPMVVRAQ